MTENEVSELLEGLVAGVAVKPAPVVEILRLAPARRRRRSMLLIASVAAAVIVIAGGTALVLQNDPPSAGHPGPSGTPISSHPPAGHRWVGQGHAVIAVPNGWATDAIGCGQPTRDTVIVNLDQVATCRLADPPSVSSVAVTFASEQPTYPDFTSARLIEVDGTQAQALGPTCSPDGQGCHAEVYLPSEQAEFSIGAPTIAQAQTLLSSLRVLKAKVAVPETRFSDGILPTDSRRFKDWATSLGLRVEISTRSDQNVPPGDIVDVTPAVGTIVKAGATVHLQVRPPVPHEALCTDLRLSLLGPDGETPIYGPDIPAQASTSLKVGDKLHLVATGGCATSVLVDDAHGAIGMSPLPDNTYAATTPGNTTLSFHLPFCDTLSPRAHHTCTGGLAELGGIAINVTK